MPNVSQASVGSQQAATNPSLPSAINALPPLLVSHVAPPSMLRDETKSMLLTYLHGNLQRLTTISLRTMIKLADLYMMEPTEWRDIGVASLMRAA